MFKRLSIYCYCRSLNYVNNSINLLLFLFGIILLTSGIIEFSLAEGSDASDFRLNI
jgi:hypothetical protein